MYKNTFSNPEFDKRFNRLIGSIKDYLNKIDYDKEDFEITNIIGWHNWNEERRIYVNDKCPTDIRVPITELIKKEFPNPNDGK
jgi:hypothetical protein